jgi:hypothetical protein
MKVSRNDEGVVDVFVSAAVGAAVTAPVFISAAAAQVGQDPLVKIGGWAVAIAAVAAICLALWRSIGRPLLEVLGGRPPRGIEGEPGYDPGSPPLQRFIRDSMRHRDLDTHWKERVLEQVDDLVLKAHDHNGHTPFSGTLSPDDIRS